MRVRRIHIGIRRPEESLKEAKEIARRLKVGEKLPEREEELYILPIFRRCEKLFLQSALPYSGVSLSISLSQCGNWPKESGEILRTSVRISPFFLDWGSLS